MRRALLAEALGTFGLVFAGTGAIVVNDVSGGAVTHVGVSLAFGLIVMTMIYALGDVSGAHLNPAVSAGFALSGRISWGRAGAYGAAQIVGAVCASLALRAMFAGHETLGATTPAGGALQSAGMEAALTAMLMLVILAVATGPKEKGLMAGVAVGGAVALGALVGGPVSGASMNPARSLGPALVAWVWEAQWVYLAAPLCGAALAVGLWRALRGSGR